MFQVNNHLEVKIRENKKNYNYYGKTLKDTGIDTSIRKQSQDREELTIPIALAPLSM